MTKCNLTRLKNDVAYPGADPGFFKGGVPHASAECAKLSVSQTAEISGEGGGESPSVCGEVLMCSFKSHLWWRS